MSIGRFRQPRHKALSWLRMAIGKTFTDWPRVAQVGPAWPRCSPSLVRLSEALRDRWGLVSLGCYGIRQIRLGEIDSTHSFGAAIDLSYRGLERELVRPQVAGYLVAWSDEWHISAIHDYLGCRIWRAGRTPQVEDACTTWWKAQRPSASGMGQAWGDWFHVEVTMSGWDDARNERDRYVL